MVRFSRGLACALMTGLFTMTGPASCHSRATASRGPGTYELTWFSINTVTEQPTVAKVLLVLSPSLIPDSLKALMKSSLGNRRIAPARACWRITEGGAAMNGGPSSTATSTDWVVAGTSDVTVQLWFIIDAGSDLRFTVSGDSVRGEIVSSGWMRGPSGRASPRVVRDSVVGRRVGDPDLGRCVR